MVSTRGMISISWRIFAVAAAVVALGSNHAVAAPSMVAALPNALQQQFVSSPPMNMADAIIESASIGFSTGTAIAEACIQALEDACPACVTEAGENLSSSSAKLDAKCTVGCINSSSNTGGASKSAVVTQKCPDALVGVIRLTAKLP